MLVVNSRDLFFTMVSDLAPEDGVEKNKQEVNALERKMQLS